MNALRWIDREQRRMQFRAMQRNVRRAEALLDLGAHRVEVRDLASVPFAIVSDLRGKPDGSNARLEPEAAYYLHSIGIELQTGADPGEGGRLLIDVNLEPDPSQRGGSGQPGDPGTDDRYCRRCIRHRMATMARVNSP
jgi:hypothetical protein